jgi:putative endopeptidase
MNLTLLRFPAAALLAASACFASYDPKDMDLSVSPKVDFYQYAEGGWMKANPIPADRSEWGSFDELQEHNERILKGVLDRALKAKEPGFVEKLVGDFYYSGMDEAAVEAAGASPLRPLLDRVDAVASTAEFGKLAAGLQMDGLGVFFAFGSEQDPRDSQNVIAGQGQGGLGLPDRDYYFRDDDASKKLREKYVAHVAKMLSLMGDADAVAKEESEAVMRIETALAAGSKKAEDLRDPVANYHKLALAEVQKLSPHFDWGAYLDGMGLNPLPPAVDVNQTEFVQALDKAIASAPLADWKAYLRWHVVHDNAPFLSKAFVNENFSFYGKELEGTPQIRDRWKRVLAVIDGQVGEALGQLYVAEAFPPESKARMLKLVNNLRATLRERIQNLEWMDEPTRKEALKKLDAMGVKIGYPDKWIDYSTLVIDRGAYALNVLRATEFGVRRDIAKIGKPVDRTLWGMTPPTVNAYYNPAMNEIVFPAGILQPPFFDRSADDAANYGGIGAVIGHEMTHGFDDNGRQYDENGNLTDWWTAESAKRFKERSAGIVKQFGGYIAIDKTPVNGELTQGENIADLGGIRIAYAAFMKTPEAKSGEKIDGFTPVQRFFLSFASIWRTNQRPEALRLQVNTDPHSPARFRVNGPFSNLDEFIGAFDVPEGSPMRRSPSDRVVIW